MSGYRSAIGRQVFHGWWIVAFGSIINAVGMGILFYSFTVFFLPIKRDFGVSSAAVSLLYGAARLEGGIEGPVTGYLIDRFGPRVMIIIGASLAGVGFILLATAQSFMAFALIYIFIVSLGMGAGFYNPVSAAVNSWFIRRRAIAFGVITAASSIGGVVMAPLLSYIILKFSWQAAVIMAGLLILMVVIPSALPMHRSPEVRGLVPDGGPSPANHVNKPTPIKVAPAEVNFTVRQALRTPKYWLLTTCLTLRVLVTMALTVHLVPMAVWKGIDETTAAYLVSLFTFITIITTMVMGWLGDRWNKAFLCSAGIAAAAIGMLGLILSQAAASLYTYIIGLAIMSGIAPLGWALVGDLFGRRNFATLRGIMGIVFSVATFLSPIYAGWVFDRTGSYNIALVTFSIILLLATSLFVALGYSFPPAKAISRIIKNTR